MFYSLITVAAATFADDLLISFPLTAQREKLSPFHMRDGSQDALAMDDSKLPADSLDVLLLVAPGQRIHSTLKDGDFYPAFLKAFKSVSNSGHVGLATFDPKPETPQWGANTTCFHSLLPITTSLEAAASLQQETGNDPESSSSGISLLEIMASRIDNHTETDPSGQSNQLGALMEAVLSEKWSLERDSLILLVTDQSFHWAEDGSSKGFRPALLGAFKDRSATTRCNEYDYPSPLQVRQFLWSSHVYVAVLAVLSDAESNPESSYHWLSTYLAQPSSFVQPMVQGRSADPAVRNLLGSVVDWINQGKELSVESRLKLAPLTSSTTTIKMQQQFHITK